MTDTAAKRPRRQQTQNGVVLTERNEGILPCHAKSRRVVRLPDGRTGRLIHVAPYGHNCRIQLPSGAYVTARTHQIALISEADVA